MTTQWRWLAMLAFLLAALVTGAQAAPPTFRISQVFTSVDGGTQFVELTEYAGQNGQQHFAGLTLTMTHGDRVRTVTFDEDLPTTATAHMTVVLTTYSYYDYGSKDKSLDEGATGSDSVPLRPAPNATSR